MYAAATATPSSCFCFSTSFNPLSTKIKSFCHKPTFLRIPKKPFSSHPLSFSGNYSGRRLVLPAPAAKKSESEPKKGAEVKEEVIEEEEDLPWIQEKALDLVEFTGSVTQAIPGPRVGTSSLPWMLAVPLAYLGITFVFAFYKTVKKFNSPRELRRKQVGCLHICCNLDW